jgi:F-type H+-transporting ATPase subunit epsilon
MSIKIKIDIVSLEKEIFSGMVSNITVSGVMGELGIEHGHAPLLTRLKPGIVKFTNSENAREYFYISGGMLEIQPTCVTVLADVAEHASNLDEEAAIRAKKRAQELLSNFKDKEDFSKVQAELAKAVAQLKVIQELRNKDA